MQYKVRNKLTPPGLCRMISDMEQVLEDTEAMEEVEEDLAEVKGW